MKAVVINGSPNLDQGNTALILNPFIRGLQEAGANVEIFYAYKLNINFCLGCSECLLSRTGECQQQDDMNLIFTKICESDILILASPLHASIISAALKNILDRLYPIFNPQLTIKNNRSLHPLKRFFKRGISVLVSSSGTWEKENFNTLLKYMNEINHYISRQNGGYLIRPHAPILKYLPKTNTKVNDIFTAARRAGHEVVKSGKISKQTENIVSQNIVPREEYIQKVNKYYDGILSKQN